MKRISNSFSKQHLRSIALAAMMLVATALQGQDTPKVAIDFNITEIANFDQRTYFLYSLLNDGRFDVVEGEKDGVFVVSLNTPSDGIGLEAAFADFKAHNASLFATMSKEEAAETALEMKAAMPKEYVQQMMSVVYRQSRDNSHCADAYPFCTDNEMYDFPGGVDEPSAEHGPDYDCLNTQPNPAWYYMRIDQPGGMDIHMYSTPQVDIDFCCWGPYENPYEACSNLTSNKVVSCSYSTSWTEHCMIPNSALSGEYFILVITNYSNNPCDIHFSKEDGEGTTDCEILPPLVNNDGPYCVGDTIFLTAQGQAGAAFSWSGPNNFSSEEQNPVIENCDATMAGTYTCTITLEGQSNNSTTEVVIFPQPVADFSFTEVCFGLATEFSSLAENESYFWDFGDGETATGANVSHTYSQADTYVVTQTVTNGEGQCTNQKTMEVRVFAQPVASATAQPASVDYNGVSTLTAIAGAEGNFTYRWEPAHMVADPNSAITQTVGLLENQNYTLTVTNTEGGCFSNAEITVFMGGSNMTATATVDDEEICEGASTTLHALAIDGTHNYTYSWSPANTLSDPYSADPVATPGLGTTTYTCHVSDGIIYQNVPVTVTVHPNRTATKTFDGDCDVASMEWFGTTLNFTHNTDTILRGQTMLGCDSTMHVSVKNMQYTPDPSHVVFTDLEGNEYHLNNGDIVPVVTATEFFSFNYNFVVSEAGRSIWDECEWSIGDTVWRIEDTLSPDHRSSTCTVFVGDRQEGLVALTCKIRNNCMDEGDYKTYTFYLKSSYIDVDEHETGNAAVSIVPNPNNGQMRINFEQMSGTVSIKVFDMRGTLIDHFETEASPGGSHDYDMNTTAQGVYSFVIASNQHTITRKVVIVQ